MSEFNDVPLNLEIMAEECAEVIKELTDIIVIKSKIARFGMDDRHPEYPSNRERLELEVGHLLAMIDILGENGVLTEAGLEKGKKHKRAKLKHWYRKDGVPY